MVDRNEFGKIGGSETVVVWENLTVTVHPRRDAFLQELWRKLSGRSAVESLNILQGVSGHAAAGHLVAIMGPSGAGKTTFLAALAKKINVTRGSVKLNGQIVSRDVMSKISSYMPQFDALPSFLTVEEHVSFAYALKTDGGVGRRKSLLENLLADLGLHDCKNTLISRLSGGQKKRVSLGTELVTRPKILFLDEPTTGLDTFSAIAVIESLKTITSKGTIVFCTIHQPGMAIYNLLDTVMLMTNGRVASFGSLENIAEFMSSQGYECPIGFDESEYYVQILSMKNCTVKSTKSRNDEDKDCEESIEKICRAFSRSSFAKLPEILDVKRLEFSFQKRSGIIAQFYWLSWRIWVKNRRTIFANWIEWLSYFLSIAAIGVFYNGTNPRTQEGVQNARGALYMMTSEIMFTVAYSVIYEFPGENQVYLRESTVYESGPYYVATFLGMIPKATIKALIFTTILYFILNTEIDILNFSFCCLTTTVGAICGTAYGVMFSSWIESIEVVTTIMVPIDMLFLLTAGVFYNLRSLPTYLTCFKYASLFFYVNEALSIIYWSRVDKIECQAIEDLPCLRNGEEVLAEYGYERSNFWWDLCGLVILTISMALIGFLGIRRRRISKAIF